VRNRTKAKFSQLGFYFAIQGCRKAGAAKTCIFAELGFLLRAAALERRQLKSKIRLIA
jgi:hypothetical protein